MHRQRALATLSAGLALLAFACGEKPARRTPATRTQQAAYHSPARFPPDTQRLLATFIGSSIAAARAEPLLPLEAIRNFDLSRAGCSHNESLDYFFPTGSLFLGETTEVDAFLRSWYSRILSRMREPSLSCEVRGTDTYRFLIVPTWAQPMAVRSVFYRDRVEVTAVQLSGQGGYEPGRRERSARRVLFRAEREALIREIVRAGFWRMPVRDIKGMGVDGTQWIVEGRVGDRYHVVDRWSPRSGPIYELGLVFARLGGIPPIR